MKSVQRAKLVKKEMAIFGKKEGDAHETLLLSHAERYDLEKSITRMEADGWTVRVSVIDLETPPDFAETLSKR